MYPRNEMSLVFSERRLYGKLHKIRPCLSHIPIYDLFKFNSCRHLRKLASSVYTSDQKFQAIPLKQRQLCLCNLPTTGGVYSVIPKRSKFHPQYNICFFTHLLKGNHEPHLFVYHHFSSFATNCLKTICLTSFSPNLLIGFLHAPLWCMGKRFHSKNAFHLPQLLRPLAGRFFVRLS